MVKVTANSVKVDPRRAGTERRCLDGPQVRAPPRAWFKFRTAHAGRGPSVRGTPRRQGRTGTGPARPTSTRAAAAIQRHRGGAAAHGYSRPNHPDRVPAEAVRG